MYGINRVPADVDPAREALAELEAAELMAPKRPASRACESCRRPCNDLMTSARGAICPDCYDRADDY